MNRYRFIEAEKAGSRNVKRACELLKVSRAAFYAHLAGPSQHERADAELTGQIKRCMTSRRAVTRRGCTPSCTAERIVPIVDPWAANRWGGWTKSGSTDT